MVVTLRKKIIAAVILITVFFSAWYWASPRWTLHEMKAAAQARDTDKLVSYIDFPALRANLKEEMKAKLAAEFMKPGQEGMAVLGAAFASSMIDGMVDGMVTPSTIRKVFVANKEGGPEGITRVDATGEDLIIDRDGFDRFRLHPGSGKDAQSGLVFERHGLGWKLAGMKMAD